MQSKTVHKSVQAWLYDKVYHDEDEIQEGYNKDNFTVLHQRPITISRRIERAVGMNVTDKWAGVPYQGTEWSTLIGPDPSRYSALIG